MVEATPKKFNKNVNVLKYKDVTRIRDEVYIPNYMTMGKLKKSEGQYKKDVEFTTGMDGHAVKSKLEETLPILKNQR